jgi:arylsulfatase A-like enzyme
MTQGTNYLFIIMDSVRAQNVGHLGYERNTTPSLDEFAESATVYTQARSPDVWSLPSHVSMFTGLHTPEHGIRSFTSSLAPENTVFDDLRTEGYDTACFSTNQFLTDSNFGLADAFDQVYSRANVPITGALAPRDTDSEGTIKFLKDALRSESPGWSHFERYWTEIIRGPS